MLLKMLSIALTSLVLLSLAESAKTGDKFQLFAFVFPHEADFDAVYPKFDWNKLTTLALATPDDLEVDRKFVDFAHERKVKVVSVVNFDANKTASAKFRRNWTRRRIKNMMRNKLDGINVDFEAPLRKNSKEAGNYLKLIKSLSGKLRKLGKELSVDVAWSPDCIDGRCYPFKAISEHADYLFVMAYDEQSQMWNKRRNSAAICRAKPNSPLRKTFRGIKRYLEIGVKKSKLILGLPWYGYEYPCVTFDPESDLCEIPSRPFRGCNCSDAAGSQKPYSSIVRMTANVEVKWDEKSQSPYFNVLETEERRWQVWFDNPDSLYIKSHIAKDLGLGGVGMWNANSLDYSNDTQIASMWNAFP